MIRSYHKIIALEKLDNEFVRELSPTYFDDDDEDEDDDDDDDERDEENDAID